MKKEVSVLRVFEAFSGYGSQRMALQRLGIPFEIVGTSDVDEDVILSYAAIHTSFLEIREKVDALLPSNEEMVAYLEKINVPLDYKTFKNKARALKKNDLKDLYIANKLSRNYGDIQKIDPAQLPDFDLFTYSFPCQDISVAGYQNGLNINSGTRSSLLWECCKIIEKKRPRFLLMENVKNLVGKNHKHNFDAFLQYLESLGYHNNWKVLNARDYGIPQNRERVFCVSSLDGDFYMTFHFPDAIGREKSLYDYLETEVDESLYLKNGQLLDHRIDQEVSYCLDANYWKGVTLDSFLEKHRRQLVTDKKEEHGFWRVRRLTPLETWRLMGVSDEDFYKAKRVNNNTNLYRQSGNSIVVNVLEAIFRNLLLGERYDK